MINVTDEVIDRHIAIKFEDSKYVRDENIFKKFECYPNFTGKT